MSCYILLVQSVYRRQNGRDFLVGRNAGKRMGFPVRCGGDCSDGMGAWYKSPTDFTAEISDEKLGGHRRGYRANHVIG